MAPSLRFSTREAELQPTCRISSVERNGSICVPCLHLPCEAHDLRPMPATLHATVPTSLARSLRRPSGLSTVFCRLRRSYDTLTISDRCSSDVPPTRLSAHKISESNRAPHAFLVSTPNVGDTRAALGCGSAELLPIHLQSLHRMPDRPRLRLNPQILCFCRCTRGFCCPNALDLFLNTRPHQQTAECTLLVPVKLEDQSLIHGTISSL